MSARCTICVFAKPPIAGEVKTRLAASMGPARAAMLAKAFLADTWSAVERLAWAESVLTTTRVRAGDFEFLGELEPWLQGEGDLGMRIARIARRALENSERVIIIGADSPGLPTRLLEQARDALTQVDAVLGPADDGGFYLLALRRCPHALFDGISWSAPSTFAETRARLEAHGLTVDVIAPWFDIDTASDLARLRRLLEQGKVTAPATERVLLTCADPRCDP